MAQSWLFAAVAALSALGCVSGPYNKTQYPGPVVGREIKFSGYATAPGAKVTVRILDPYSQDPTSPTSIWSIVTIATAATTPVHTDAAGSYYEWSANGVIATQWHQAIGRWPEGGQAYLKADQDGVALATFESNFAACVAANAGKAWREIAEACKSKESPVLTLIDLGLDQTH